MVLNGAQVFGANSGEWRERQVETSHQSPADPDRVSGTRSKFQI